ncbi:hypothetical protein V6N11_060311 [Hibiscus sabdariffa]|uniref:Uncharacterized protein n=1 Tax=Hibiscus sabdariffa TaxID=183260 RepID=A0ABR2QPZ1_9ROSI
MQSFINEPVCNLLQTKDCQFCKHGFLQWIAVSDDYVSDRDRFCEEEAGPSSMMGVLYGSSGANWSSSTEEILISQWHDHNTIPPCTDAYWTTIHAMFVSWIMNTITIEKSRRENDMLHQFLMGLNVEYHGQLRGNILAQDLLPSLNRAYQLAIQDERVRTTS